MSRVARCAVVTGGAHGLGRAYARRLADDVDAVAVVDLDEDAAGEVAAALVHDGTAAEAFAADVADARAVEAAVAGILDRFGRIDVLVNNAGGALYPTEPFDAITEERWDRILDVNLKSQWLCSRAAVPAMREQGGGAIVNISSTVALVGRPVGLSAYAAAKAGVLGLTRALARELGGDGIRVNAVCPGYIPVTTPKDVHTADAAAALRERMVAEQCLKRLGKPEDLAEAVAFLASDAAAFVTGQALSVDGGWTTR